MTVIMLMHSDWERIGIGYNHVQITSIGMTQCPINRPCEYDIRFSGENVILHTNGSHRMYFECLSICQIAKNSDEME